MRIACLGGGPAGLYFAICMKLRDPAHDIVVIERNKPFDTFGWGVVFSDQTMDNLRRTDPVSAEAIHAEFAHWDDIDVHFKGRVMTSRGHGFVGIGRKKLLNILQDRALELGVQLEFEREITEEEITRLSGEYDLVIASDGINSRTRQMFADVFQPDIEIRKNKFIWLGTHKIYDAFTFIFEQVEGHWVWVHAYKFDPQTSTFIVECGPEAWTALGFDTMTTEETIARCEEIFAKYLDGHKLMSNARHLRGSAWLNFPRVSCKRWYKDNIILMGDAAHTAHFSIGSGTKLALEDAIDLAAMLHGGKPLPELLEEYQQIRGVEVLKLQSAARNSTEWFETVERYLGFEPEQFAYSMMTRSQRISHENLRQRDRDWLEGLEGWYAAQAGKAPGNQRVPPMFTPYTLRGMTLKNRIVVSPMSMYSATDGLVGDFHMVHYGARAQGGAGLIFTEMTDVSPEGRITPGCAGIWTDAQEAAWKRIVDFVHAQGQTKFCLQLGHAGPKGSTQLGWEEMDAPLKDGNWEILAPSALPWSARNQVPRAMTRADMDKVRDDHVAAAIRGDRAGFDMLELHYAHGYLMSAFITPVMNKRDDEYGGSLENRLRFPLEVFRAVRAAWPKDKPISIRISSNDWVGDLGITPRESVAIARAFRDAGVDIIDVSAGQTSKDAKPIYGRMFQTPFSDQIRNEVGMPTMAVGNITEPDQVNSILLAGRADLVCLARPHLVDPYWTLHAATRMGDSGTVWPLPYLAGAEQARRLAERAQEAIRA
jgi:anthraniloyl-CoA monooxygenase